jgi:hypothetical protein
MEKLIGLPMAFVRDKQRYVQLAKEKYGLYLYHVRGHNTVSYQVGHVTVQPAVTDAITGAVTPAYEAFEADATYTNEVDGRQGLKHAVAKAQQADAAKPKRTRRKKAAA